MVSLEQQLARNNSAVVAAVVAAAAAAGHTRPGSASRYPPLVGIIALKLSVDVHHTWYVVAPVILECETTSQIHTNN